MNVLSFSFCFPSPARPTWGVFVLQRLAALAESAEVQVVSPVPTFPLLSRLRNGKLKPRDEWSDLTVHRPKWFYFPGVLKRLDGRLYARGIRKWLEGFCRDRRPDVLDAHFVWPDGVAVGRLARRLGIPYTITLRGWLYEAMGNRAILAQCVEALQNADAIISVSGHLARTAVELGADESRMHVIPNGVDTERFTIREKSACRAELDLAADARLIVAVGHLGPRKGQRENVQALARLPEDVHLVAVGGDPDGGRNEREVRELIDRLGLAGRVVLTGPQPYDSIPKYLSAADVSVLASHREGCPNVVLESLASGTPVVATNVGAVPDLVQPGENGEIVPPRDVDALAGALGRVLASPRSPEQVRRSKAVKSWGQVADAVRGVLEGVARAGAPGGPSNA